MDIKEDVQDNFTIAELNAILPNGDLFLFNVFFEHFEKVKKILDTLPDADQLNVDYVNENKSLFGMCCEREDYVKEFF